MPRAVLIFIALALAFVGLFFADPRNQRATQQAVRNAAAAKPVTADVAFKLPFVPDGPTPTPYLRRYPARFMWGDELVMKYQDMGDGYLQTVALNLNDGHEIKDQENEWLAHIRFKFNPEDDPLHPGHSILGVESPAHELMFAPLGQVDFDTVRVLPLDKFIHRAESELPAVWRLKAGDVIGIKIFAFDMDDAGKRLRGNKTFGAKIRISMLSHSAVRFDYVYRTDGQVEFPAPVYMPDEL